MMGAIDRAWRVFGTGMSFIVFGLGGLLLALTVFPFFNVFVRDRERRSRLAQRAVRLSWRVYVASMQACGVVSSEAHGAAALREARGCVIVANHPSLLDIVFLLALTKHAQCVVKAGVWHNPFMSGVVRAADYIPNLGDPERLLQDCVRALKNGNNLMIFPEGSRSKPGQKPKYQRGFAHVAIMAGAPVQLVTIQCDPPSLRKGEPWYKIPPRRSHWIIRVHERIDVAAEYRDVPSALAVRKLCQRVEARFEESLLQ